MTVIEFPRRHTPRPREYPGGRSGRAWRWTALSGFALVVLATIHIAAQHFAVHGTGGLRNYHQVLRYIANPLMFAIECMFVLALSIHAMLGIRSIVRDFDLKPRTNRRIERGLWALGTVTAAYGIVLLSILAARA